MIDFDEEFGPNRTPMCNNCGERLSIDEICWCSDNNELDIDSDNKTNSDACSTSTGDGRLDRTPPVTT